MTNDAIPKLGSHRGVALHDQQSPARLIVVRQAIDRVFDTVDVTELARIVEDVTVAPEARAFAIAKVEATLAIAADRREVRPSVDLEFLRAVGAGLDSQQWRDREHFCTLFDRRAALASGQEPIPREKPLAK